jgi:hypothetical protein
VTSADSTLGVVRWRKYGKDRLYVSAADGQRIGWVDLVSGLTTLEVAALADAFATAIGSFCLQNQIAAPVIAVTPIADQPPQPDLRVPATVDEARIPRQPTAHPVPVVAGNAAATRELGPSKRRETTAPQVSSVPIVPEWQDLAGNRPGQAVRAQAESELAAMRQRSQVGTVIARVLDMKTQERAWRVGADGEEAVGARLDKLVKQGWHVLHSVPVGKGDSDIDHVLIGPGGVFTVNTKRHPNKAITVNGDSLRVGGYRQPYLRNSRFEADRASKLLSEACGFPVLAKATLVFLTGTLLPDVTIKRAPADVAILDRMDIPGIFRRSKRKLDEGQISAIYEQARRSTTWKR